jgi:hypothetical protein
VTGHCGGVGSFRNQRTDDKSTALVTISMVLNIVIQGLYFVYSWREQRSGENIVFGHTMDEITGGWRK